MSATFVDHYAVLGVPPAASPPAIREAYMRLAKLYHPDLFATQGDNADKPSRY